MVYSCRTIWGDGWVPRQGAFDSLFGGIRQVQTSQLCWLVFLFLNLFWVVPDGEIDGAKPHRRVH